MLIYVVTVKIKYKELVTESHKYKTVLVKITENNYNSTTAHERQ